MALSQAQMEHIGYLIGQRKNDTELPLPPLADHGEAVFPSQDARDYEIATQEEIDEFNRIVNEQGGFLH